MQFRETKSEQGRKELMELLNKHVTNLTDLFIQTKLAHWNVRGPRFIAYHEFFDDLAGRLPESIDMLAEQVGTLGGTAGKPIQFMAQETSVPAWRLEDSKDIVVIEALTERWAIVANSLREAIDVAEGIDANTADLFTEVSRQLDKDLWFLESHLSDGSSD